MSVGDGFMIAMAAAPTDTTTAISGDVEPQRRGKSKAPNFTYDGPMSVIGLELDVSDARARRRLERQWAAVFRLRRALQRDAAARCRAYAEVTGLVTVYFRAELEIRGLWCRGV
ncbi:MAG: hypothetical protein QOH91_1936 [Mycobacterium sp.]|jgi:hypothetical protein|nr:hypothetical protein [Mycobacterium sp.]